MDKTNISFNLIKQHWIICADLEGELIKCGLLDVFKNAHKLKDIEDQPFIKISIYRLMQAILHRVFGPPNRTKWGEMFKNGEFDINLLEKYFNKWYNRFDLFDDDNPFYQCLNVNESKKKPINKIMLAKAAGNNKTLFNHTFDSDEICIACDEAARNMLAFQNYGNDGRGKTRRNGILKQGIIVLLKGANLFENLMFNLLPYQINDNYEQNSINNTNDDMPCWEQKSIFKDTKRDCYGYIDYLTWQNKKMLLIPSVVDGNIKVYSVVIEEGLAKKFSKDSDWTHPSMIAMESTKDKKYYMNFKEGQSAWRNLQSLLMTFNDNDDYRCLVLREYHGHRPNRIPDNHVKKCNIALIGALYDKNKSNARFWEEQHIELPSQYLTKEMCIILQNILQKTERALELLLQHIKQIARTLMGMKDKKNKQKYFERKHTFFRKCESHWCQLDIEFPILLENLLGQNIAEVEKEWYKKVKQQTLSAFNLACQEFNLLDNQQTIVKNRVVLKDELNKLLITNANRKGNVNESQ